MNRTDNPETTVDTVDPSDWHYNLRFLTAVGIFLLVMFSLAVALIRPWIALIYFLIAGKGPAELQVIFNKPVYLNLAAVVLTLLLIFGTALFGYILIRGLKILSRVLHPLGLARKLVWIGGMILLAFFFGALVREIFHWLMAYK